MIVRGRCSHAPAGLWRVQKKKATGESPVQRCAQLGASGCQNLSLSSSDLNKSFCADDPAVELAGSECRSISPFVLRRDGDAVAARCGQGRAKKTIVKKKRGREEGNSLASARFARARARALRGDQVALGLITFVDGVERRPNGADTFCPRVRTSQLFFAARGLCWRPCTCAPAFFKDR